jgi:hypothetical protein
MTLEHHMASSTVTREALQRRSLRLSDMERNARMRDRRVKRETHQVLLARFRTADIRKLLWLRCGEALPEADDGREYLKQLLIAVVRGNVRHAEAAALREARRWAPWMEEDEAKELIHAAIHERVRLNPGKMAVELGVTLIERVRLGLKTVRCVDATPEELKQIMADLRAARLRFRRRAAGMKPSTGSAARTKPWEAEGVSRRTWYRQRAK